MLVLHAGENGCVKVDFFVVFIHRLEADVDLGAVVICDQRQLRVEVVLGDILGEVYGLAVDSTNEGTLSAQLSPPALHMEDFDDATQWVEARADSGLNRWNPSNLGWEDGYINFTYAWYADTGEGIEFYSWNGTTAELQWYEYSGGTNQEHEWDTYSWQLPQWVLDETEFAFRFEILGAGDADEVYVDNVTLEREIDYGSIFYEGNITVYEFLFIEC